MKFPEITTLYSLFRKSSVVTTDSRKIIPDSLFFALKGDNFNGNRYAESAITQGCGYAVVDDEEYYKGENYILVKNCLAALQELAAYHRKQLKIPCIAITGSNGKTATKELIKSILSRKYKVLATAGNLNNHIGVPITILSITPDIEIAIIEMGANHIGEIAMLCEIVQPDYGLITNIGKAHIGEFGGFESIVQAKTEMFQFLKKRSKKVFIHSANDLLMSRSSDIEKITYGSSGNNFCTCLLSGASPYLKVKYENDTITSQFIGKYNFENIAAAICIGKYFKVETRKIKEGVEEYIPSDNRSQVVQTKKNTIILDAYNANPSSMRAAIEDFYDLPAKAFAQTGKWLILGDMHELGEYEKEEHKNILQLIAEKKFQNVILVGEKFSKAVSEMKINFSHQFLFKNSDELAEKFKSGPLIKSSSLVLIKGSRGMKLEKAVEYL